MRLLHTLAIAIFYLGSPLAFAACNNPANWFESPGEGVKFVIGHKEEEGMLGAETMNGVNMQAYPNAVAAEVLARHGTGTLGKDDAYVSYFEPNPAGGWRICRTEKWWPRDTDSTPSRIRFSQESTLNNKRMSAIAEKHDFGSAHIYLYDAKGRISRKFLVLPPEKFVGQAPEIGELHCYRYDGKDRVLLWLKATGTKRCPTGEPDPRDYFHRFEFSDIDGETWGTWAEQHYEKADEAWEKRIHFISLPKDFRKSKDSEVEQGVSGYGFVFSDIGTRKILGGSPRLGEKDKSHFSKWTYADGGLKSSEYFFTKPPVPIGVLRDPEKIYQYDRRRETSVSRVLTLVEHFRAGEHQVRDRFYTAVGRTVRQEQYDTQGRLKRVINLLALDPMQDGKFYGDEDLKHAGISPRLKSNEIFYRVWDYDAGGKATLVALGWNARLGSAIGKGDKIDFADIRYGTPDGKQKWKSAEEFFKAFDFDPNARRAYPDIPKNS